MKPYTQLELASKPLQPVQEPSVAMMLQAIINQGVTSENVTAMERLCALYERMEDKKAEREFASAFSLVQSEMPRIEATKGVPDKNGKTKFKFAPYEEIMEKAKPTLEKHGFTIAFDNEINECRIVAVCKLRHVGGHSVSNSFAVRIGSGPPGASECQADGAASTYAKRFALCNALNIVIEKEAMDDEARAFGSPIPEVQAKELRKRVKDCGADEAAFLQYAGAAQYEAIPAEAYSKLDTMLTRKEIAKGIRDENGNWTNF